jgi:hypothetical protein
MAWLDANDYFVMDEVVRERIDQLLDDRPDAGVDARDVYACEGPAESSKRTGVLPRR